MTRARVRERDPRPSTRSAARRTPSSTSLAIAGRLGVDLPLDLLRRARGADAAARQHQARPAPTSWRTSSTRAACPAVLAQIADLLHLDARTVTGRTMGEAIAGATIVNDDVIRPRERAAPRRAAASRSCAATCARTARCSRSRRRARRCSSTRAGPSSSRTSTSCTPTIDDPALDIQPDDVLVLQNGGPVGGARACPRPGHLPMPAVPAAPGRHRHGPDQRRPDERHRLRHGRPPRRPRSRRSAGRSPSSRPATGSGWTPPGRRLDLLVGDEELAERRRAWVPRPAHDTRGYRGLYLRTVMQANEGCDLDFLVGSQPRSGRGSRTGEGPRRRVVRPGG